MTKDDYYSDPDRTIAKTIIPDTGDGSPDDGDLDSIASVFPEDIQELPFLSRKETNRCYKEATKRVKRLPNGKRYLKETKRQIGYMLETDRYRSRLVKCRKTTFKLFIVLFFVLLIYPYSNDFIQAFIYSPVEFLTDFSVFGIFIRQMPVVGKILLASWLISIFAYFTFKILTYTFDSKMIKRILCKVLAESMSFTDIVELKKTVYENDVRDILAYYPLKNYGRDE